jgi:hypothetical protein
MLRDIDPHGTVEELIASGADLRKIGSCSRKRKDEDGKVAIIGCLVRKWCELDEKDGKGPKTSGKDGAGPCRKVVMSIKVMPDGRKHVTRVVLDCFHIPGYKRRIEASRTKYGGGLVQIVGGEGDEVELPGSVIEDKLVPGQGTVRSHVAQEIKTKIEKFPRPGEKYNLPGQKIAMEETAKARAAMRDSAPARLLGLEDDDGSQIPEVRP